MWAGLYFEAARTNVPRRRRSPARRQAAYKYPSAGEVLTCANVWSLRIAANI
jgi:hypothetical protein